jgi:hypothetical protein
MSSIFVQYLTSLTVSLNRLTLPPLVALMYLLLLVMSAGYVMITWGARKLKRIEEV